MTPEDKRKIKESLILNRPLIEKKSKKIFRFLTILVIIMVGGLLTYLSWKEKESTIKPSGNYMNQENLTGKKAVMIVAYKDFRDEEYFVPREVLESAGVEIKTVSTEAGQAVGADGGQVNIDLILSELNVDDFDAVIFIGGSGALKYLDNEKSYQIARETLEKEKILAAICVSPTILARAGVLSGKKATVWSSPLDKSSVRILEENQAIYQADSVVVDGKIITANGPSAARKFGEALITALK